MFTQSHLLKEISSWTHCLVAWHLGGEGILVFLSTRSIHKVIMMPILCATSLLPKYLQKKEQFENKDKKKMTWRHSGEKMAIFKPRASEANSFLMTSKENKPGKSFIPDLQASGAVWTQISLAWVTEYVVLVITLYWGAKDHEHTRELLKKK